MSCETYFVAIYFQCSTSISSCIHVIKFPYNNTIGYQYNDIIGYPYGHFGGGPDVGALVEVKHRGREDACHIAEEDAQNIKTRAYTAYKFNCTALKKMRHVLYDQLSLRSQVLRETRFCRWVGG